MTPPADNTQVDVADAGANKPDNPLDNFREDGEQVAGLIDTGTGQPPSGAGNRTLVRSNPPEITRRIMPWEPTEVAPPTGNTQVVGGTGQPSSGPLERFRGSGGQGASNRVAIVDQSTNGPVNTFNPQAPTPRVLGIATDQPLVNGSTITPVCPPVVSSFQTANSTAPYKAIPNKNAAISITDDDIRAEGRKLIEQRVVPHVNTDFGSGLVGDKNELNSLYLQAASFDSKFHQGENNQQLFEFRGRILTGSELNYYYQGLFFATYGSDLLGKAQMKTSIYAWKAANYKELPSKNTIWAANQGFEDGVDFQFTTSPKPSIQDTIDKFQQVEAGQCLSLIHI